MGGKKGGVYYKFRMFDPEYKNSKPTPKKTPPSQPSIPATPLVLQTREDQLHHYLNESESCRRAHGFAQQGGKFYLVDKDTIERLGKMDSEIKDILRNWVKKKQVEKSWGGEQGGSFGDK